jgi:hypothetical protein
VSPPTMTHQEKSRVAADMEVLPDDPESRALYRQHWQSIRTEEATGNRVQDSYNFTLHEMTASTFTEMVHRIFREQTTAFKIKPVASSVRMDCQCCLYKALDSGSSGRTSMSAATRLFSWWVIVGGDTVRRCFVTGPDSGATDLFIGSLCLASGLSCWA